MNKTKNNQSSDWNRIYQKPSQYRYYNLFKPHPDLKRVIGHFKKRNVIKVLDLGCGLGRNFIPLARFGFNVTGIDQAPNAIKKLKTVMSKENINGEALIGNFQNLLFADESFDAVISIQTINHGYQDGVEKGIAEIERVLCSGGSIFVTVPGRIAKGEIRYSLVKTAQKVSDRVYIPTVGKEKGIPHFIFNKELIKKMFSGFNINFLWKDKKDYYCFIGKKKL